jgi:hypothetical protein
MGQDQSIQGSSAQFVEDPDESLRKYSAFDTETPTMPKSRLAFYAGGPISETISRDNVAGDCVRRGELLAYLGQKTQNRAIQPEQARALLDANMQFHPVSSRHEVSLEDSFGSLNPLASPFQSKYGTLRGTSPEPHLGSSQLSQRDENRMARIANMESGIEPGGNKDFIDILRHNTQFRQLRRVVKQQPQRLEPILKQVATGNPAVSQLIEANSKEFVHLLSEEDESEPPPTGAQKISIADLNHPFTAEETAILEAVQNDRRRREIREQRAQEIARGSAAWRSSICVSSPSSSNIFLRWELHPSEYPADPLLAMCRKTTHTFRQ